MKLIRILILTVIMASLGATSCLAELYSPVSITKLGAATEQYDWPQGLVAANGGAYVMDGTIIKFVKGKKVQQVYGLSSLQPELTKKGLNGFNLVRSFRMAQMEYAGGQLYVSGLLFDNREDEKIKNGDRTVLGDSYILIFTVKGSKASILQLSKVKTHWSHGPFAVFETKSGAPEDTYAWGDYKLYDYAKYILYPRFMFYKGALVFLREKEGDNRGALKQVVKLKGGKEEIVFEWYGDYINDQVVSWHFTQPVLEEYQLKLYTGDDALQTVNLLSGEIETERWNEMFKMQRPRYRNGQMLFLNNERFFIEQGVIETYEAKDFAFSGNISGYDFDGKNLYVLDYDSRSLSIFKIKP